MTDEELDVIARLERNTRIMTRISDLANSIGWDGVNNSKFLHVFLEQYVEEQKAALAAAQSEIAELRTKLAAQIEANKNRTMSCVCGGEAQRKQAAFKNVVSQIQNALMKHELFLVAAPNGDYGVASWGTTAEADKDRDRLDWLEDNRFGVIPGMPQSKHDYWGIRTYGQAELGDSDNGQTIREAIDAARAKEKP